jgi:hypothetical protein
VSKKCILVFVVLWLTKAWSKDEMRVCNFSEEIMPLIEFGLVNSPTWVIARSVCAIHNLSISRKSNCSLYKKGGLYKEKYRH